MFFSLSVSKMFFSLANVFNTTGSRPFNKEHNTWNDRMFEAFGWSRRACISRSRSMMVSFLRNIGGQDLELDVGVNRGTLLSFFRGGTQTGIKINENQVITYQTVCVLCE